MEVEAPQMPCKPHARAARQSPMASGHEQGSNCLHLLLKLGPSMMLNQSSARQSWCLPPHLLSRLPLWRKAQQQQQLTPPKERGPFFKKMIDIFWRSKSLKWRLLCCLIFLNILYHIGDDSLPYPYTMLALSEHILNKKNFFSRGFGS